MSKPNYKLLYMQLKEEIYREACKLHKMAESDVEFNAAMRYAFSEDVVNDLYITACDLEDKCHVD